MTRIAPVHDRLPLAVLAWLACGCAAHASAQTAAAAPSAEQSAPATTDSASPAQIPEAAPEAVPSAREATQPALDKAQPALTAAPAPVSQPEAANEEPAAAQTAFTKNQIAHVRLQLQALEAERANPWWPRLTVAAGLGAALLATTVGAINTFDCEAACSAPTWVSLVVVVGAAVGVLGSIWLVRTDTDLSQVELRRRHLEYELERWEHTALERQRASAKLAPQLTLRFTL